MVNITKRNKTETTEIERIVTGFHTLDWAFADASGNKGLPLRSIIEITGQQGIGKSTFMFSLSGVVASKLGNAITLLDFERQNETTLEACLNLSGFSGDVDWATFIWEDEAKKKTKSRSEDILDLSTKKCQQATPDVVMIDSVAAFQPTAIYEGNLGDANMGIKAKTLRQWFLRTLRPLIANPKPTTVMFTNHLQPVIGGFRPGPNAPIPTESAGGTAVGYLATQSIDLVKLFGYSYPERNGYVLEGRVAKNRDGFGVMSKKKFYVYIQSGEGINKNLTSVVDCVMLGLAESSSSGVTESSTITIDGQKVGKFRDLIDKRFDDKEFHIFHDALVAHTGGIVEVDNTLGG